MKVRRVFAIFVCTAAVTTASSSLAAGRETAVTYDGQFGTGTVTLRLEHPPARGVRGAVNFHNTQVLCDDESEPHIYVPPISIRFTGRNQFSGQAFRAGGLSYDQAYYGVSGRLFDHQLKIRGSLRVILDASDIPDDGGQPDCGTHGTTRWHGALRR